MGLGRWISGDSVDIPRGPESHGCGDKSSKSTQSRSPCVLPRHGLNQISPTGGDFDRLQQNR
jgi:hypothetical protein